MDWLIVERVKVYSLCRPTESADHFVDQIGRGVWDSDAESDAGAHGSLALFDDCGDLLPVFRFDLAAFDQTPDQLIDRLPAISRFEFDYDLVFLQDISKRHTLK